MVCSTSGVAWHLAGIAVRALVEQPRAPLTEQLSQPRSGSVSREKCAREMVTHTPYLGLSEQLLQSQKTTDHRKSRVRAAPT